VLDVSSLGLSISSSLCVLSICQALLHLLWCRQDMNDASVFELWPCPVQGLGRELVTHCFQALLTSRLMEQANQRAAVCVALQVHAEDQLPLSLA